MLLGLLAVVRVLPAKKQPAVYLGVQRLHASPEHFRPTGKVGNIAHRDTVFAQKLGRSSGRKSFDSSAERRFAKATMPVLSKTLMSARSTAMSSSAMRKAQQ